MTTADSTKKLIDVEQDLMLVKINGNVDELGLMLLQRIQAYLSDLIEGVLENKAKKR